MTKDLLEKYFESRNILHILSLFIEKGIDEPFLLCRLKYSDLEKLGVSDYSDRRKVYEIITIIKNELQDNLEENNTLESLVTFISESNSSPIESLSLKSPIRFSTNTHISDLQDSKILQRNRNNLRETVSFHPTVSPREKNITKKGESGMVLDGNQTNKSKITVCVRKKPIDSKDMDMIDIEKNVVTLNEPKVRLDLKKYTEQHVFSFDFVFSSSSKNEEVYCKSVFEIVSYVLNGGNGTVLAYGQTGTGKTHTMFHPHTGIVFRALTDLLNSENILQISFLEIYNEKIFDLLNYRNKIEMREFKGSVFFVDLKQEEANTFEDACKIINHGLNHRRTGITDTNTESSRSHAILKISIKKNTVKNVKNNNYSTEEVKYFSKNLKICESEEKKSCKISIEDQSIVFVDLAGSERGNDRKTVASNTKNEGAEINKSLLALKECIRGLNKKFKHLPFRQSKLTQILKNSLIGVSKTCILATINPSVFCVDHSLNTLRYAYRIKGNQKSPKKQISGAPQSFYDKIKNKKSPNKYFIRNSIENTLYRDSSSITTSSLSFNTLKDEIDDVNLAKKRVNCVMHKIKQAISTTEDISIVEVAYDGLIKIENQINDMKF
ncbi:kinesin-like protein [Hamiltosporidium magnivora]|uniref:Kinesin-like protein n=1 Tax=Hamiltosporidium magnivora TaxID=148818 RepID=A0A4Q9LD57_9MICR|nr:kinesin-like protein [Hamiltosporidium magnivora]